jgi:hypothetical protein
MPLGRTLPGEISDTPHGNPGQVQQLTSAEWRWRRAPGHDLFRNDHKKSDRLTTISFSSKLSDLDQAAERAVFAPRLR